MSDDNSPPDDIFDRYSRDKKPEATSDTKSDDHDAMFSKYDRAPDIVKEEGKPTKVIMHLDTPLSKVEQAASGFNDRLVSGIPILGPLAEKAAAATGAALQPVTDYIRQAQGQDPQFAGTSFSDRYANNLQSQNAANQQYGEDHPVASTVADLTGSGMLLGPMSGGPASISAMRAVPAADTLATNITQRMMGMRGNSLGSRVYQGAAGMGALETGNQLLKGNNPVDQGFFGPVPLAIAGGAAAPIIGEGITAAGNNLTNWLPRRTGPLAGVNSTGRNMLTNSIEGETPASLAAARQRMGPSGMLADVNNATTDLVGGLADIPGPHKQVVREAFRQRAAGQGDRIEGAVTQAFGPRTNVLETTREMQAARRAEADPLYEAWRDTQVHPTTQLKALMPRLEAADVITAARAKAAKEGLPFDENFFTPGRQKNYPTAQSWDYVKRGLDSKIATAQRSGDNDEVRILSGMRRDLINAIDNHPNADVSGVWREARQVYAHHSSLLEQLDAGQNTFSRNYRAEDLADELRGLARPELQARIQGARDAVQKILGDSVRGDTTARNMLLAHNNQDKLRLLLGHQQADRLIQSLESEVTIRNQTQNVTGGTQTTPKKERVNAMLPQPSEMGYVSNLNVTKPATFIPEWMKPQTILEGARAERHADAYHQIAPLLTRSMSHPRFDELVDALLAERARGEVQNRLLSRVGSAATGAIAVSSPALRNRLLHQPATP